MSAGDELIEQVLRSARIATGKRRREIERELRTYIEDFIGTARESGHSEDEIAKMFAESFGDAAQVAWGFARVYRRERAMVRVGVFLLSSLIVTSSMLSAVLAVQAGVALGFGNPALKLLAGRHTVIEILDVLFTVTTYTGLVALEELFEGNRFFKALGLIASAFALLIGVCAAVHVRAPFLIFGVVNGSFFRTIQVFIRSGAARTGMVAAGIALLGVVSFQVMPFRFPYVVAACVSWLTMGAAYRQMPAAVARMDAALLHHLRWI